MKVENVYRIKIWVALLTLIIAIILIILLFYPHYLFADMGLLQLWHPRFYKVVFWILRFIFVSPFLIFALAIYVGYPILKNKRKELFLFVVTFFICLIIAEVFLRGLGFRPGYTGRYPFFSEVDSLYEMKDYGWDDQGIVHFSNSNIGTVNNIVEKTQLMSDTRLQNLFIEENDNFDYCSWLLIHDFGRILNENNKSLFSTYIKELKTRRNLDDADSAVIAYSMRPINSDGFKSMSFKNYTSKKKKVLLIGDSFTYGMSAHPVYNCYADLLLTKGYIVWNPSFPNNDPENYLQIAKKYIPVLKPDIVVVCFYMGNDVMMYDRNTVSGKQHFFATNAGWINGEFKGCYFDSAKQAYEYYLKSATIGETHLMQKWASKTTISTLVYHFFYSLFVPKDSPTTWCQDNPKTAKGYLEVTNSKLKEIAKVCSDQTLPLKFVILPDIIYQNPNSKLIDINEVFKGIQFCYPNDLEKSDYVVSQTDGHFNNAGHLKALNALENILEDIK